jgi:hypothetical protein
MSRQSNANRQAALWLERIAWNAAAGAVLAVMILVLLGSLEWLDTLTPHATTKTPAVSAEAPSAPAQIAREPAAPSARPPALGGVARPSG